MTKLRPSASDALFKAEREILALYDQGLGIDQIVECTDYSAKKVRETIGKLSGLPCNKMRLDFMTGSRALLAAIQATGRVHA